MSFSLPRVFMVAACALLLAAGMATVSGRFCDWGGDSAQYIIIAESLAQGHGLRMANYPGNPVSVLPPLLSWILSLIYMAAGRNFWAMHLFVFLCASAALMFHYLFLKGKTRQWIVIGTILSCAMHPLVWAYAHRILTDIVFVALSGIVFYSFDRFASAQDRRRCVWYGCAVLVSMTALYFCRYIGILMLVPLVVKAGSDRWIGNRRTIGIAAALVYAVIVALWSIRNASVDNPAIVPLQRQFLLIDAYRPHLGTILASPIQFVWRMVTGINAYVSHITDSVFPFLFPLPKSGMSYGIAMLIAMATIIAGMRDYAKKYGIWLVVYCGAYFFFICAWPMYEDGRYVLPLIPFVFFYFYAGIQRMFVAIPHVWAVWIKRGLVAVCMFALAVQFTGSFARGCTVSPEMARFLEVNRWLQSAVDSRTALIFSRKPTVTSFLTGARSIVYPYSVRPEDVHRVLRVAGVSHVIADEFSFETARYLVPFLRAYPDSFICVLQNGGTKVFEYVPLRGRGSPQDGIR